jgi:SET domain-containing protein
MVKVDFSKIDGRGVFATGPIYAGTELTCEVMLFENGIEALAKWSYPWSRTHFSFCVGFGSFFNHSDRPNVRIKGIDKEKLVKTFVVTRKIDTGEELFLDYGKNKFS